MSNSSPVTVHSSSGFIVCRFTLVSVPERLSHRRRYRSPRSARLPGVDALVPFDAGLSITAPSARDENDQTHAFSVVETLSDNCNRHNNDPSPERPQ